MSAPAARARRVIAIDPGSVVTGWGIVDGEGNRLALVECGVIRCGRAPFTERLELIHSELLAICRAHEPGEAAIEGLYFHRNADSALKLGHARAAAILALRHSGLEVTEYEPSVVKKSVTGKGGAAKEQVRAMVGRLVRFPEEQPMDASDAVAIAICHLHRHPALARRAL